MAEASEREIKALIALLDDTDREVFEHVSDKLFSMGPVLSGYSKMPILPSQTS